MTNRKGLTLIELILTLAIFSIVIPLLYSLFFVGTVSHSVSTNKGFAQQDIRIAADFITEELRLVTDIGDVELESNEYYSLKINAEGNIVKSKYVRQVDDSVVETTINTISGNLVKLNISNTRIGVIDILLEQTEQSGSRDAGFDLTMAISTENSPNLFSDLALNLIGGDILYYQNTRMTSLSNSIYLNKPDEVGGGSVTVRFYRNDGAINLYHTITGIGETTESLPVEPLRGGYTFTKWTTNVDGSGISYGSGGATTFNMPSNDTDLHAIWEAYGNLQKVTIDTTSGTDGIVEIDSIMNPSKNAEGRFIVDKSKGSIVKIKLNAYTSNHDGKVSVIVNNSTTVVEEGGYISFKAQAGNKGNGTRFFVDITIKTEGYNDAYTKRYNFIND